MIIGMGKGLYAKLDTYMIGQADKVAKDRHEYAKEHRDVYDYGIVDWDYEVLGARCERAACVFFPGEEWHKFTTGSVSKLPDLGEFIDVKGVPFDRYELLVPCPKLNPDFAYVFISAEYHPYYWLAGWEWGSEMAKAPVKHKRPCYAKAVGALRKIHELQRICG